jgi:hypothetical protein
MVYRNIMKFFIISLILSFILFPLSISTNAYFQPYVNITIYASHGLLAPGESNVVINFTLINSGNVNLTNIYIKPLALSNLIVPIFYFSVKIPFLSVGKAVNVPFIYNISPNAGRGAYQVPLSVGYTFFINGSPYTGNMTLYTTIYILGEVKIIARAILGTPNQPLTPSPGSTNIPMTIYLTNVGNLLASNVRVYFPNSSYPLKFLETYLDIGYLPVGNTIPIITYVDIPANLTQGVYKIPLVITYFNGAKLLIYADFDFNSFTQFEILGYFGARNTTLNIPPGAEDVPLTISLINLGNSIINNATLIFKSYFPIKFLISNLTLGILVPFKPYTFTIPVDVAPNSSTGLYNIPVELIYNNRVIQNLTLKILINGYVNFNLYGIFGTPQNPIIAAPGETNVPMTIIIQNIGNSIVSNVTIYFPNSSYPLVFREHSITVGYISPSIPLQITTLVDISNNVSDGIYSIPLLVKYFNNSYKISYLRVSIIGYVELTGYGVFGTVSNPILPAPGSSNIPFTIILENVGNVILSNATIVFPNSSYPIKFLEREKAIGYLPISQPISITTYVNIYPNVSIGVYQVPIKIIYFKNKEMNFVITLSINSYLSFDIKGVWGSTSSPITVSAGAKDIPLTIVVRNIGTASVDNVTLYLNSNYPIQFLQNIVKIGFIPAGSINYATIYGNVMNNVSPGVYQIPVILSYSQGVKINAYLSVIINGPNISAIITTYPPKVFINSVNPFVKVSVILINYGEASANDLSITLYSQLPVISQKSFNIGSMLPGRIVNITFLLQIPENISPSVYQLKFNITYDGGSNIITYPLKIYPTAYFIVTNTYYSSLNPGANGIPITIFLRNIGNDTAKNAIVILQSSNVISPHVSSSNPLGALSANRVFLGDITENSISNVTFIVDVSSGLSEGYYPIVITIIWNQTGSIYPFMQNLIIYVPITLPLYVKFFTNIIADISIAIVIIVIIVILLRFRKRKI